MAKLSSHNKKLIKRQGRPSVQERLMGPKKGEKAQKIKYEQEKAGDDRYC